MSRARALTPRQLCRARQARARIVAANECGGPSNAARLIRVSRALVALPAAAAADIQSSGGDEARRRRQLRAPEAAAAAASAIVAESGGGGDGRLWAASDERWQSCQ